jgi:Ribbon-helix-helix protein, copG family
MKELGRMMHRTRGGIMPKAKVSVTVEGSLLRQVDRMARGASRSEVFEDALASWLRNRRRERLEEEIQLYYRSLGAAEREEDAAWAELRPISRRELEMNGGPLRGCRGCDLPRLLASEAVGASPGNPRSPLM